LFQLSHAFFPEVDDTGQSGSDRLDIVALCFTLGHVYQCGPDQFLNMPLDLLRVSEIETAKLMKRQRTKG
jgi:hypothetical protein